jgi:hypothetical protein
MVIKKMPHWASYLVSNERDRHRGKLMSHPTSTGVTEEQLAAKTDDEVYSALDELGGCEQSEAEECMTEWFQGKLEL